MSAADTDWTSGSAGASCDRLRMNEHAPFYATTLLLLLLLLMMMMMMMMMDDIDRTGLIYYTLDLISSQLT